MKNQRPTPETTNPNVMAEEKKTQKIKNKRKKSKNRIILPPLTETKCTEIYRPSTGTLYANPNEMLLRQLVIEPGFNVKTEMPRALTEEETKLQIKKFNLHISSLMMLKNKNHMKIKNNSVLNKKNKNILWSKIFQLYKNKFTLNAIQATTGCREKKIKNIIACFNRHENILPNRFKEKRLKWKKEWIIFLYHMMKIPANWFLTTDEISNKITFKFSLSKKITSKSVRSYLKKMKMSYKKAIAAIPNANSNSTKIRRKEFIQQYLAYYLTGWTCIFMDETGIYLDVHPEKGWFLKGNHMYPRVIKNKSCAKVSLIGAVTNDQLICYQIFESSIKSTDFTYFVIETCMLLEHKLYDLKKCVFIFDNAAIHKFGIFGTKLLPFINVLFLPPYSPFLNPIERVWASWKHLLKKKTYATEKQLIKEITIIGKKFEREYFNNNFYHSFRYFEDCFNLESDPKPVYIKEENH